MRLKLRDPDLSMSRSTPRPYLAPLLSIGLHLAVLTAGLVAWPWLKTPTKIMAVTPVTVISKGPINDVSAALEDQSIQAAATETPADDAPLQAPKPEQVLSPEPQQPKPASPQAPPPPAPSLKPIPIPKPFSPPLKPVPAKAAPGLDLDALANRIRPTPAAASRASSAQKGRSAVGAGRGSTLDVMQAISARLGRLWNPNCGVEGSANVVVKVRLNLAPGGRLVRATLIDEQRLLQSGNGVLQAAATRALTAVARAAPYDELPAETYADWRSFVVSFDARQICRGY